MELYVINILVVIVALIAASYYDLKRKEIPNNITYALIISGFIKGYLEVYQKPASSEAGSLVKKCSYSQPAGRTGLPG